MSAGNQKYKNYYKEGSARDEDQLDIRGYLLKLWKHRYWFVLSIGFCLAVAFLFNRLSTVQYPIRASLLISDNKTKTKELLKEVEIFETSVNLENEIQILKSQSLVQNVVDSLGLNIEYYKKRWIGKLELYGSDLPFRCVLLDSAKIPREPVVFTLQILTDKQFEVVAESSDTSQSVDQVLSFGEVFQIGPLHLRIEKTDAAAIVSATRSKFTVGIFDAALYASKLREEITIKPLSLKGSILEINYETPTTRKGIDLINALIYSYIQQEVDQKNLKATNAIEFIDNQLISIQRNLLEAEDELEKFRTENKVVNLSQEGLTVYNRLEDLENRLSRIKMQLEYYDYLIDYINKAEPGSVVSPSTADISDETLNALVVRLNEIGNNLTRLGSSASDINPQVQTVRKVFESTLNIILENVTNQKNTTLLLQADISQRIKSTERELRQLPANERQLINIRRGFNLNEDIYVYLLKQKAEAGIAKASNEASSKVVDEALALRQSKPKKALNLAIALLLGFLLPIAIIASKNFISITIQESDELKSLTEIPVLTSIAQHKSSSLFMVNEFPRSDTTESFRRFRASLRSLFPDPSTPITVMFTSFERGEGKTFMALNTSIMMAQSGIKTLLLELDMRNPSLSAILNLRPNEGITGVLSKPGAWKEAIQSTKTANLDFLGAGATSGNSDEVFLSEAFALMMLELKKDYQLIVIDTPPLGLFADALELNRFSDASLYVVRRGVSRHEAIHLLNDYSQKTLISNPAIVFNGTDPRKKLG